MCSVFGDTMRMRSAAQSRHRGATQDVHWGISSRQNETARTAAATEHRDTLPAPGAPFRASRKSHGHGSPSRKTSVGRTDFPKSDDGPWHLEETACRSGFFFEPYRGSAPRVFCSRVGIFTGSRFQESPKIARITCRDVSQDLIGTEKRNEVPSGVLPVHMGGRLHVNSSSHVIVEMPLECQRDLRSVCRPLNSETFRYESWKLSWRCCPLPSQAAGDESLNLVDGLGGTSYDS